MRFRFAATAFMYPTAFWASRSAGHGLDMSPKLPLMSPNLCPCPGDPLEPRADVPAAQLRRPRQLPPQAQAGPCALPPRHRAPGAAGAGPGLSSPPLPARRPRAQRRARRKGRQREQRGGCFQEEKQSMSTQRAGREHREGRETSVLSRRQTDRGGSAEQYCIKHVAGVGPQLQPNGGEVSVPSLSTGPRLAMSEHPSVTSSVFLLGRKGALSWKFRSPLRAAAVAAAWCAPFGNRLCWPSWTAQ